MPIYEALKRAVEYLQAHGLMPSGPYRLTASRDDDKWVFWFQVLPETPGLDVTALVSDNETVTTVAGY